MEKINGTKPCLIVRDELDDCKEDFLRLYEELKHQPKLKFKLPLIYGTK